MYVEGFKRKLFNADVIKVNAPRDNHENVAELRKQNKKNNTIKRRLQNEGLN